MITRKNFLQGLAALFVGAKLPVVEEFPYFVGRRMESAPSIPVLSAVNGKYVTYDKGYYWRDGPKE